MNIKRLFFTGIFLYTFCLCYSQLEFKGFVYDGEGDLLIDEPNCIANSKDDYFVYVAGCSDDAISLFARDTITGLLTYIEGYKDGIAGIEGLHAISSLVISQDNKFLYATGFSENALAAFTRDTVTSKLTLLDVYIDGQDGVDGLFAPAHVAVSYDNKTIYVAGLGDDAIAVFSRDIATGELTFVEIQKDGIGGVDGLDGAQYICLSPDDKYVYAAGSSENALAVFSRNTSTGELTYIEMLQDGVGGVDGLNNTYCLAISQDNKHLYAAAATDHAVSVFSRNTTDGTLTYVDVYKDGTGGIEYLYGPRHVMVNHQGKFVYASSFGDDAIVVFSRDSLTGELSLTGEFTGLDGATYTLLSNNDSNFYSVGRYADEIRAHSYDTATGEFSFLEAYKNGLTGINGLRGIENLVTDNEGDFLYTIGTGDRGMSYFTIDSISGELTFVKKLSYDLNYGKYIAISPDNNFLYLNSRTDDQVYLFSRNLTSGDLSLINSYNDGSGGIDGLDGAYSICISGDGRFLYVTGVTEDAIASFNRNISTGELTYTNVVKDGENGVDGLDNPNQIAISPDNKFLYATGTNDDAISIFSCDSLTGELTYVEMVQDGVGGVEGLNGCRGIDVTNDNNFVYSIGNIDDAISVFSRNTTTGQLSYINTYEDGQNGITGLDNVYYLTLSPDNKFIYTVGNNDDMLSVFSRDTVTGELAFIESHQDGTSGVDGLGGPRSVTVSPNNRFIYAGGYDDDAISFFEAIIPVELGNDTTFCLGDSLVLDAGSGLNYSYAWSEGSSSQIITVKKSGVYSVIITDGSGRMGKDTISIEVTPEVILDENVNICSGDSAVLTVSGGDNYLWSTTETTESITVFPTLTTTYSVEVSTVGCLVAAVDSIIVYVNPVYNISIDTSLCMGDSIYTGGYYKKETGIYYDTLVSKMGCDSIIITDLFINPSYLILTDTTICEGDSAYIAGQYRTIPGDYYDSLTTVTGCDSIIRTDLIINPSYLILTDTAICEGDSVYIAGQYRTIPGDYYDSLTTVTGCDSIIRTDLIINPSYLILTDSAICYGDSVYIAGDYQTTPGEYYDSLISITGCDSIIEINLTIRLTDTTDINQSICNGDSYLGYTSEGIYYIYHTNHLGCDSVVKLDLTVNELPIIDLGKDTTIYTTDTLTLDAGAGFSEYTWSTGSEESSIIVNSTFGIGNHTIWASVKDNNDCINSDTIQIIIEEGTDILEIISDEGNIKFYPNPSEGQINMSLSNIRNELFIDIISVSGTTIYEKKINVSDIEITEIIDISAYPDGIYFIKVYNHNYNEIRKLIIK